MQNHIYRIRFALIKIITETEDKSLKTFKFVFLNPDDEKSLLIHPASLPELSIPGLGEIPIGIASSPAEERIHQVYGL
ncbi:MAG: hypothetical protein R2860_16940 [Desulfobacterales bacterium]